MTATGDRLEGPGHRWSSRGFLGAPPMTNRKTPQCTSPRLPQNAAPDIATAQQAARVRCYWQEAPGQSQCDTSSLV